MAIRSRNSAPMWQLAEPGYTDFHHSRSHLVLWGGVVLSALVHLAVLAVQWVSEAPPSPMKKPLNVRLEVAGEPIKANIELSNASVNTGASTSTNRDTPAKERPLDLQGANRQDLNTPGLEIQDQDIKNAVEEYYKSAPDVTGRELEGRVFNPELAAKIYEARRNSKARSGLGPGSFEQGAEHSLADPGSFNYSAGLTQRWVKVNGKCFLVHEDSGVGPLKGAFSEWMRTSCKRFNSKFFEER